MRKSAFSETQIVEILKDAESGVPVADLLREHGGEQGDVLRGAQPVRRRDGGRRQAGAGARGRARDADTDVRRPRARECGHQGGPAPNVVMPSARRQGAEALVEPQLSVQRACRVVRLSRTVLYQPPVPASRRDAAVIAGRTDAVARSPRWGFGKLDDCLRVDGRSWTHKRVHRVHCALRLNLPRRTTRRVPRQLRRPAVGP